VDGCGVREDQNMHKKKRGRIKMVQNLNCGGVKGFFTYVKFLARLSKWKSEFEIDRQDESY
jgi:hypothetical protein